MLRKSSGATFTVDATRAHTQSRSFNILTDVLHTTAEADLKSLKRVGCVICNGLEVKPRILVSV